MKKELFILQLHLFLGLSAINAQTQEDIFIPDSLITLENVYTYCLTDPQKAQRILDIIREKNDDKLAFDYEMDWAQADLYYNRGKYGLASYYFERVAAYDTIRANSDFQMGLLSTMMECYRLNNDFDKTMECALLLLDIAKEKGNKAETGRAYLFMGKIFFRKGNREKADEYFVMAEQQLKASDDILYLYHFYLTLANLQDETGLYPQALETARLCENVLKEMEDIQGMPEKYMECEQSRFDALMADILAKNKKTKEADIYYKRFIASSFAEDAENKIHIVPYLLTIQNYKKAIEIAQEREIDLRQHTDTIGDNMLAVKQYLITAYQHTGNISKAFSYARESLAITDSLRIREQKEAALESAIIYETQEKDAQIQYQKTELKSRTILLANVSVAVVLLLVLVYIIYRNMRAVRAKNLALVQRIREIRKVQEEQSEKLIEKKEESLKKQPAGLHDETDCLYVKLYRLMNGTQVYKDSQLTRDTLSAMLSTNRNTLANLIHKNTGLSTNDYINSVRLDASLRLLEQSNSNENIDMIAEQVGLSKSSFYRLFRQKYGMTPKEYRDNIEH